MTYDAFVYAVGLCVVFASTFTVVVFMLAILASWTNEKAKDFHRAAVNTYWWSRWIRWHRIARIRAAIRGRGK